MMKWWLAHRILMNKRSTNKCLLKIPVIQASMFCQDLDCASLMGEKDGYHTSMAPAWQTECYFKIVTIFILQHNPNLKWQYQVVANVKIKNSYVLICSIGYQYLVYKEDLRKKGGNASLVGIFQYWPEVELNWENITNHCIYMLNGSSFRK